MCAAVWVCISALRRDTVGIKQFQCDASRILVWKSGKGASGSRKYIDLIRVASAKWANWDPPVPIQVRNSWYAHNPIIIIVKVGSLFSISTPVSRTPNILLFQMSLWAFNQLQQLVGSASESRNVLVIDYTCTHKYTQSRIDKSTGS